MKTRKISAITFIIGLTISAAAVPVFGSSLWNRGLEQPPVYSVNESGLTYGSAANAVSVETEPHLISAVGIDGTKGYVYSKDLQEEMPKTPEEAVAIMKDHKKALLAKSSDGKAVVVRTLPLYDLDGKTIIGEFAITGAPNNK
ncbi:hypothetical protein [Paenibacillus assamensis]|uniref:hypothetical protein n=1 Tax=Paenibacillus assamensis TaxID=311244 RepID=UPI00042757FC|nr:hypothetical protein [Paenibacillus assamensis]